MLWVCLDLVWFLSALGCLLPLWVVCYLHEVVVLLALLVVFTCWLVLNVSLFILVWMGLLVIALMFAVLALMFDYGVLV